MTPYYSDALVTLYHGDCRDVLPTVTGRPLLLTDPPYGIALANHGQANFRRRRKAWTIAGDHDQAVGQAVLDHAAESDWPTITFASPMRPWAGEWRQYLVWDKGGAVGGGGDPLNLWKMTWELIQIRRTGLLNGPRDSAVLRFVVTGQDFEDHPAAKPVPLLAYLIRKVAPTAYVFDPFAGSGSTLVAAKLLGRRAVGVEIDPVHCATAARRLSQEVLGLAG